MSEPDEVRALSRWVARELGGATGGIGGLHEAIAARVFGATGAAAAPVARSHRLISGGVYASVRGGFAVAGLAADAALRARATGDGRSLSSSPRGAALLGVLNGLYGDALEAEGSDLQQPMAVRAEGRIVAPDGPELARAFPRADPWLIVFVHGLMETERAWRFRGGPTYGERLERELGCTAVDVRYNSGRHISDNGRSLAELLDAVVVGWPVDAERIALVGHSMGGLVARSAAHQAHQEGRPWAGRVRHVVSLGSPHMGAPLAQGLHYTAHALHAVPELRPLARLLRRRSAGIRDLRSGSLVDQDWRGRDAEALRAAACAEVPLLPGATHCFVSATITRAERHPVARLLGDMLVLSSSAAGRGRTRRLEFRDEHGLHVGGAHHLALLNHPAVYARLCDWLSDASAPVTSSQEPGTSSATATRASGA